MASMFVAKISLLTLASLTGKRSPQQQHPTAAPSSLLHGPLDHLVAVRARLGNLAGLQLRLLGLGAQVGLHRLGLDDVAYS